MSYIICGESHGSPRYPSLAVGSQRFAFHSERRSAYVFTDMTMALIASELVRKSYNIANVVMEEVK